MTSKPLAFPAAIVFIAGLALVYYALRGFDAKHGLLGGRLSGTGATHAGNTSGGSGGTSQIA